MVLASSPGLRGGEREGLVSTACACASGSVYFTVKTPVKLKVDHGHERRSCTEEVPGEPRGRGTPALIALAHTACNIELLYIHDIVHCGVMAAINSCRFCGSTVLPKHCVGLFSKEGLEKDLPGRAN